MLVRAKIAAILSNGLWVKFWDYFAGTINIYHLDQLVAYSEVNKEYTIGKVLTARILYTDPTRKKIGLTLRENCLNFDDISFETRPSEIFEDAIITRLDKSLGLTLTLPNGEIGFVHVCS